MNGGVWIIDPKTGEKTAGVRDENGIARPLETKKKPKARKGDDKG